MRVFDRGRSPALRAVMRTEDGRRRRLCTPPRARPSHHGHQYHRAEEPAPSFRKRRVECDPNSRLADSDVRGPKRRKTGQESRPWVFSTRDLSACRERFVIVSYNILGVENASKHPDLYEHVEPKNLDWNRRKWQIRRELRCYSPSIVCFQEVDRFDDLANLLQEDGYTGIYKGRTGEANDGCAIFWKEERFSLLHEANIEFQKFGLRNNVAQLCVFKMLHNGLNNSTCTKSGVEEVGAHCDRRLLVGNIHVLFNPNRGDIKLGQIRLLLEKAHEISVDWGTAPVVIAGDFNSMPKSALYQFMESSELDILMHDRRQISGQIEYPLQRASFIRQSENCRRYPMQMSNGLRYRWSEEEILLASGNSGQNYLRHALRLRSAYPGVPVNRSTRDKNGEPLVTSYHSRFMGAVDYIWHSSELVPIGLVETLPINVLRKIGCLPSERWGSDHLALVCELAFLDDDEDATKVSES